MMKPIHAKPSLYAYYYADLKELARAAGWNLLLHGSMNRDLDLILIPWAEIITKTHEDLIAEFCDKLGGWIMNESEEHRAITEKTFHGRRIYVININRSCSPDEGKEWVDPQYYIDISVIPLNYNLTAPAPVPGNQ